MGQTTKERYESGDQDLSGIWALSHDAHCKISLLMKTLRLEDDESLELTSEEKRGLFYMLEDIRDMVMDINNTVMGEPSVRRV